MLNILITIIFLFEYFISLIQHADQLFFLFLGILLISTHFLNTLSTENIRRRDGKESFIGEILKNCVFLINWHKHSIHQVKRFTE